MKTLIGCPTVMLMVSLSKPFLQIERQIIFTYKYTPCKWVAVKANHFFACPVFSVPIITEISWNYNRWQFYSAIAGKMSDWATRRKNAVVGKDYTAVSTSHAAKAP